MNLIFMYFLLISAHIAVVINGSIFPELIEQDIEYYCSAHLSNFTGSNEHNLKLSNGGRLGETSHSLVWKGVYSDEIDVAVKIIWTDSSFNKELEILKALNAIDNPTIEEHGIPRIYYHGRILHMYFAIAMTLFNETLMDVHDRYKAQGKILSELSILLIFRQAIETLKYLNTMNVVHNDIKPGNLFRRGAKVFISDFDLATLNGQQTEGHSKFFASSNFFAGKNRSSIDDIESLVFSMWYIAGVTAEPSDLIIIPEGLVLLRCKQNGTAKAQMMEKCKHFKDKNVREGFELVAADEMLKADVNVPDFERITTTINNAIDKICGQFNPTHSEWLKRSSSIEYSMMESGSFTETSL